MKHPNAKLINLEGQMAALTGLILVYLLAFPATVKAIEDPPGCRLNNGGLGNTSFGNASWFYTGSPLHVGDVMAVTGNLGMLAAACKATNVTATLYTAGGLLTNFLVNATLIPGDPISCPADARCQAGPYNVTITADLVGATVNTPLGTYPGVAKAVWVVENGIGTVLTGEVNEQLEHSIGRPIPIVTPDIQTFSRPDLAEGQTSFLAGAPIRFRGYVTNRGDITLTNVTVIDSRAGQMQLVHPANGSALTGNVILAPGAYAVFTNSFMPTLQETSVGRATNVTSATARDTTEIGGPKALVASSAAVASAICASPCLFAPTYTANNEFQFTLTGEVGANYVIQVSTNLGTTDWLPVRTNAAPFTFVESNAALYPVRFYRAVVLP